MSCLCRWIEIHLQFALQDPLLHLAAALVLVPLQGPNHGQRVGVDALRLARRPPGICTSGNQELGELLSRGAGELAIPLAPSLKKVFLLGVLDQHRQRGFVHVKLVNQPLVRLPAEIPEPISGSILPAVEMTVSSLIPSEQLLFFRLGKAVTSPRGSIVPQEDTGKQKAIVNSRLPKPDHRGVRRV